MRNDFNHVLQEKVGALQDINFDVQQKCVTAVLQSTDGRGNIISSCIFQIVGYLISFFYIMPTRIRILFLILHMLENQNKLFWLLFTAVPVCIVYLSCQRLRCHNQYFGQYLLFRWNGYECRSVPECRSDRIRIHNTVSSCHCLFVSYHSIM
jgi:hypothetical protein